MQLSSSPYVLHAPPISFFSIFTPTILGEEHKSLSSLLCSFLHSPVTSSHLGPNILLNIEFSNTLNVRKRPSFIFIQNNWHNYSSVQLNLWWGTRLRSWLRHCPTSRKVAGSIPDGGIEIFHWHNPSVRTMALGLTQPLTEMSTRNVSWGWRWPVRRADNPSTFMCRLSWNLGASTSWNPKGLSWPVMGLLYPLYIAYDLHFWIANWKTKDSVPNDSNSLSTNRKIRIQTIIILSVISNGCVVWFLFWRE